MELVAMFLQNTAMYLLRNMIAFGHHIALICTYLKTSSLSGYDKKIPHALDVFTSDVFIQELAIAHPFAFLIHCPWAGPGPVGRTLSGQGSGQTFGVLAWPARGQGQVT
jgi:hypothetical protein